MLAHFNKALIIVLWLISSQAIAFEERQSTITVSDTPTAYIIGHIGPGIRDYILSLDPKKTKRIHLYSSGGKLRQALAIAEYIRKNKIETYVGEQGKCYSACTVIFQAGVKRIAHKTATFMYHYAFNRSGPDNKIITSNKYWTDVMCNALIKYGVLKDLIGQITPYTDLYLTAEEAMSYGIVTTIED